MLHKQRYEQLDAEGTATQRAKGQRDDPEESAMYCGRVRPFGTIPHKMLPYLAGLTLPHRADGGVDANLMESPYPKPSGCNTSYCDSGADKATLTIITTSRTATSEYAVDTNLMESPYFECAYIQTSHTSVILLTHHPLSLQSQSHRV